MSLIGGQFRTTDMARVSTTSGELEVEILPPGDSAMSALRSAMRGVLEGAAQRIPELAEGLEGVLTLVGDTGRRRLMGSFTENRWELSSGSRLHQIFLSGQHLGEGAEEVADTLIHELAHLLAHLRGIKDTSDRGRYHSKKFKSCAEELGLTVGYQMPHGHYTNGLNLELRRRLSRELQVLQGALVLRIRHTSSVGSSVSPEAHHGTVATRKYVSATCRCAPSRVIRVATGHWDVESIICRRCGEFFIDSDISPAIDFVRPFSGMTSS